MPIEKILMKRPHSMTYHSQSVSKTFKFNRQEKKSCLNKIYFLKPRTFLQKENKHDYVAIKESLFPLIPGNGTDQRKSDSAKMSSFCFFRGTGIIFSFPWTSQVSDGTVPPAKYSPILLQPCTGSRPVSSHISVKISFSDEGSGFAFSFLKALFMYLPQTGAAMLPPVEFEPRERTRS